jgi:hypothetical protein
MEATRPTPVDLTKYQVGQSRDSVISRVGAPQGTTQYADGASENAQIALDAALRIGMAELFADNAFLAAVSESGQKSVLRASAATVN